jgi:hypothetical protein
MHLSWGVMPAVATPAVLTSTMNQEIKATFFLPMCILFLRGDMSKQCRISNRMFVQNLPWRMAQLSKRNKHVYTL